MALNDGAHVMPTESWQNLDLREVARILKRRQRMVCILAVLITTTVAVIAAVIEPRYTAESAVVIDPHESRVIDTEAVVEGISRDESMIETHVNLIASESFARRVAEELDLVSEITFDETQQSEAFLSTLVSATRKWLPESWLTKGGLADQLSTPPSFENMSRDALLDAATNTVLSGLDVLRVGSSYIIGIRFTATDADVAARVANKAAQLYVEDQLERKRSATTRATEWLQERLADLREQVVGSERAVETYRAENELRGNDGITLNAQQMADLNRELILARAEKREKQAQLRFIRELQSRGAGLEAMSKVVASPIISGLQQQEVQLLIEESLLREEYGERHPRIMQLRAKGEEIRNKIQQEVQGVIRNLENDISAAEILERTINESLDQAKARSALAEQAEVQLRELERQAEADRGVYNSFLNRYKQLSEQEDLLEAGAKVAAVAAVPEVPSFPKPKLMIAAGFTGSLIIGILFAFTAEYFDTRLRTGDQLERVLGIANLGFVPKTTRKRSNKIYLHVLERPRSSYAEAIRAVQTAVDFVEAPRPTQVVLFTSSLPGEGKTTLALSFAVSAARSGHKTIIVDLDMRYPSVAHELDYTPSAGLTEFLTGDESLDKIVQPSGVHADLDVIALRRVPSSPSDLLRSPTMTSLLTLLRSRYRYVVLDAPPILGITDTRMVAKWADAVLFVVQWEKTTERIAWNALKALLDSHAHVAGAVLTQVDMRRHAKYKYGDVVECYGRYKKYYSE